MAQVASFYSDAWKLKLEIEKHYQKQSISLWFANENHHSRGTYNDLKWHNIVCKRASISQKIYYRCRAEASSLAHVGNLKYV